jgi:hypothetical protein
LEGLVPYGESDAPWLPTLALYVHKDFEDTQKAIDLKQVVEKYKYNEVVRRLMTKVETVIDTVSSDSAAVSFLASFEEDYNAIRANLTTKV